MKMSPRRLLVFGPPLGDGTSRNLRLWATTRGIRYVSGGSTMVMLRFCVSIVLVAANAGLGRIG